MIFYLKRCFFSISFFKDSDSFYGISILILLNFPKKFKQKKETHFCISFGGIVRIRTGVGAFAEPSLAARPRRH